MCIRNFSKVIVLIIFLSIGKKSYPQDVNDGFNLIVTPPELSLPSMMGGQIHSTILRYIVDQRQIRIIIDPSVINRDQEVAGDNEDVLLSLYSLEFFGERSEDDGLYSLRASLVDEQSSIIMKTSGRRNIEERHVIHTTREILEELFWGDGGLIFEEFEEAPRDVGDSIQDEQSSVSSPEDMPLLDESKPDSLDSPVEEAVAENEVDDAASDDEEEVIDYVAEVEEDQEDDIQEHELFRSPVVDLRRDRSVPMEPGRQVFTNSSASLFYTREVVESSSLIVVENDIQRINFKGDAALSIEGNEYQSLVANITIGSVIDSGDFEIEGSRSLGLDFRYDFPSLFTSFQLGLAYDSRPFINLLNPGEGLQSWDTSVTWLMARIRFRYDVIGFLWSEFRFGVGRSFLGRTKFNRSGESADIEANQIYFEFSQNIWRNYYVDIGFNNITVNSASGTEFLNESSLLSLGLSYRGW